MRTFEQPAGRLRCEVTGPSKGPIKKRAPCLGKVADPAHHKVAEALISGLPVLHAKLGHHHEQRREVFAVQDLWGGPGGGMQSGRCGGATATRRKMPRAPPALPRNARAAAPAPAPPRLRHPTCSGLTTEDMSRTARLPPALRSAALSWLLTVLNSPTRTCAGGGRGGERRRKGNGRERVQALRRAAAPAL